MAGDSGNSLLLNQFIPYLMANLSKRISDSCSVIYEQDFDVTVPEWRILARLAESDRESSRELAMLTFMDKSKVSRAVKLLDSKGYLKKELDEADNRVIYLSLSKRGRRIYNKIALEALSWESEFLAVLNVTEYRNLISTIEKLDHRLDLFTGD